MATLKTVNFSVNGRGHFPIDMLRYDQCWPTTQEDVVTLLDESKARTINLSMYVTCSLKEAPSRITRDRWSSFGWIVRPSVRVF